MASTKTPASKTNGGSGRLPSTRERRPALAALAILLIVGGALASAWLAVRSGHRADYLQVRADVGQGQTIKDTDLEKVELPEDFEGGVPEDDIDDVVGQVASTPWTAGMVLTDSMVSSAKDFDAHIMQIGLPVGSLAADLDAGNSVGVYTGGSSEAIAGTVASEPSSSDDSSVGSGEATATISLPVACGTEVANASQDDSVTVVKLASTDIDDVRTDC